MTDAAAPVDIAPGQTWEIDLLRPEDATGVVRLFRTVYGDGYPVQAFVDPQELIRANAEKRIISSVARTPSRRHCRPQCHVCQCALSADL